MFLVRLFSSVVGLIIFFWVMMSGKLVLNVAVTVISFMALLEMYISMRLYKHIPIMIISILAAFAFTFGELASGNSYLSEIIYVYVFLSFLYFVLYRKKIKLVDLTSVFFVTFFICYFFANIVYVRHLPHGKHLVWIIFISSWISDSFAYFTGKLFGKHKLLPVVSPKKTIEGSIGGLVFCVLANIIYGFMMSSRFSVNFVSLTILSVILGIVAQFGDLVMSAIKRDIGVKDFGNIIPGHGGILDRFDSVLFVAPAAYMFLQYFKIFV